LQAPRGQRRRHTLGRSRVSSLKATDAFHACVRFFLAYSLFSIAHLNFLMFPHFSASLLSSLPLSVPLFLVPYHPLFSSISSPLPLSPFPCPHPALLCSLLSSSHLISSVPSSFSSPLLSTFLFSSPLRCGALAENAEGPQLLS
jgi:hypothetical protein